MFDANKAFWKVMTTNTSKYTFFIKQLVFSFWPQVGKDFTSMKMIAIL